MFGLSTTTYVLLAVLYLVIGVVSTREKPSVAWVVGWPLYIVPIMISLMFASDPWETYTET
jgi:hypothetical protein